MIRTPASMARTGGKMILATAATIRTTAPMIRTGGKMILATAPTVRRTALIIRTDAPTILPFAKKVLLKRLDRQAAVQVHIVNCGWTWRNSQWPKANSRPRNRRQ